MTYLYSHSACVSLYQTHAYTECVCVCAQDEEEEAVGGAAKKTQTEVD